MYSRTECLICSNKLIYLSNSEGLVCYYCNEIFDNNVKCTSGHFVCEKCQGLSANDLIETYCIKSKLEDPFELATILMRNPKFKIHGPEHHFLVPAVLLAAFYNAKKSYEDKESSIQLARKRAEKISGGFCNSHGNCGAAVGTGIFISLITNTTTLSKCECKLSNLMTSKSLYYIGIYGGPRCCKRNTFLSIKEATNFLEEIFGTKMNISADPVCEFAISNKECKGNECPFFDKELLNTRSSETCAQD